MSKSTLIILRIQKKIKINDLFVIRNYRKFFKELGLNLSIY